MSSTTHSRPAIDVLLLDAEHRQVLASLRVLARAGLTVGVVACQSQAWWAPGLKSRYSTRQAIVPDYSSDAAAYTQAILDLLDAQPARMVVPASDGAIQALRLRRADIEQRSALPLASEASLDIAISKSHTLALANQLGLAVPRGVPVSSSGDLRAALNEVGLPAVVKPVESWVERNGHGVRLAASVVVTPEEAAQTVNDVLALGGRVLVQEWLPGRREAVSLFYARGRFWARMAQMSHREWPVLGGVSVLCETIALPADIGADATRLVQAIDLEGCSMVEFRRDRYGRPVLMEVNPRMGGSVALAIAAGVNFPQMLYDWKLDQPLEERPTYGVGQRLRWLAGDVWNLKSIFEQQGRPDVPPRAAAAATFVADFFRPTLMDGFELGDARPFAADMNKLVIRHGLRRARRWLSAGHACRFARKGDSHAALDG